MQFCYVLFQHRYLVVLFALNSVELLSAIVAKYLKCLISQHQLAHLCLVFLLVFLYPVMQRDVVLHQHVVLPARLVFDERRFLDEVIQHRLVRRRGIDGIALDVLAGKNLLNRALMRHFEMENKIYHRRGSNPRP